MSFSVDNKYFISSMRARLGPLAQADRQRVYLEEFRSQVMGRIATAYSAADNLIQLTAHYRDLLQVLYRDEADWILQSVFFEPQADALIEALLPEFEQIGQEALELGMVSADLFLGRCAPHSNSRIKGYLKTYFMETIEASEAEWEEEDSRKNPLINLLELYVMSCITETQNSSSALSKVLFHFAKLWQVYYSMPFSNEKASVLLHRLSKGYQQLDKAALKIDLLAAFQENDERIQRLSTRFVEFPLDLKRHPAGYLLSHQTIIAGGFWIKKNDFFDLLETDRIYFRDLRLLSIDALLEEYSTANESAGHAYIQEIDRRSTAGTAAEYSELQRLSSQYQRIGTFRPELRKILKKLVREHYIFF